MLSGELVYLSPVTKDDLENINILRNNWDLKKLTLGVRFPITTENDLSWYTNVGNDMSNRTIFFSVRNKKNKTFLGLIQLSNVDWVSRNAMVGIQLNPEVQGKGVGTDALKLISDYCFYKINLHKITAHIADYNIGSIKLFEKNGYILEGVLRNHIYYDLEYSDLRIYSLFCNKNFSSHSIINLDVKNE